MQRWNGGGPGQKWLVGLVAALALVTVRCAIPTNPGLPTWDIPMALPFSEQVYDMVGLVSQDGEIDSTGSGIEAFDGGQMRFVYQDSIPYQQVSENDLRFNPELEHTFITATDTITIDPQEERQAGIGMREIVSGVPWNDGDTINLPDGEIPTDAQEVNLDELETMAVVHVVAPNGGGMDMTLRNNTNVVWDEINVTIALNEPGRPVLDEMTWTNLQPNAEEIRFADLSGDSLKANLLLIVNGSFSAQTNVQLFEAHGLEFTMNILELKVDWAEAIVEKQEPQTSTSRNDLNQEDWIERAVIRSGALVFEVENQTDVRDSIYVTFPNFFVAGTDDTLRSAFEVARSEDGEGAIHTEVIDLAGYALRMPLPDTENGTQGFEARTTVVVLGSEDDQGNPRFARVAAADSVITRFYTEEMYFERFDGLAKDISIDVDRQEQELDVFEAQPDLQTDLLNNFQIDRARFVFDMDNGFDFPMRLILAFSAENAEAGETFDTTYVINLEASQDTFSVDDVQNLINILPNRITFTTAVRMGRDHFPQTAPFESRSLSLGDSLQGQFSVLSPFRLVINDTTAVRPAPTLMGQRFDQPLTSVRLISRVSNTVPIGGTVYLLAGSFPSLDVARQELTRANIADYQIMTPLPISAAPIDPTTGRVLYAMQDSTTTEIPAEAIDVFNQEDVYVRQVLVLNPTNDENGNPQTIAMYQDDAIAVTILGEVTYRVNEPEDGGN